MPRLDKLTSTLSTARAVAADLGPLLTQPARVISQARFIAKKIPAIVAGLKYIGKNDKDEQLSIGTFLEKNARERPDEPAILYENRGYSHREFNDQANRIGNWLWDQGIRKGDAVAILMENRPEILFAVAGAVKIGAIAAIVNTRQRKHVLEHSFSVCNAKLFVIGEELYDAFAEVRSSVDAPKDRVLYVPDSAERALPEDVVDSAAVLLRASTATPLAFADVKLGDPCFYVYTSGTTGMPKASIMSHFRWVKAAGAFGKVSLNLSASDVVYLPLPLYHNNALTVTWSSVAVSGAAMVIRRKFSASNFWHDVRNYRATAFCYIGELCRYLMNQPEHPSDKNNTITKIIGNGLRPDIWKQFKERFGIDEVYEFYAASEGNVAFVNAFNRDCTVGFCPAPYALVKYDVDADEPVKGPDGHLIRVGRGEVGLLVAEVSEKYSFDGYTDKAATEKKLLRDVFVPGDVYFNSGDLLRDQGYRHAQFVDRVGDTYRWKGENVSTNEVAEVFTGHDQIEEVTVYGVQVPGSEGRAGMAAIVTKGSVEDFDLDGLARRACAELPPYAVPVFLRFRPQLELTGTFKQKKGELKRQGFDVATIDEPMFVMLPKSGAYTELTEAVAAELRAGTLSL